MFSKLHDRLGTAGFVVAIVALVAALTGTAFAALPGLNSKQKKEVTKIAKKYAGKPGVPGATGPPGPAGVKGDTGGKGDQGIQGIQGDTGSTGKSVVTTAITTAGLEGQCVGVGGTKVEVEGNAASKKFICNGKEGPTGPTGTSLPSGKTETGIWSFVGKGIISQFVTISFPLRTTFDPTFNWIKETGPPTVACPGTAQAPTATAGNLCLYAGNVEHAGEGTDDHPVIASASLDKKSGIIAEFAIDTGEEGFGIGTWALTAP